MKSYTLEDVVRTPSGLGIIKKVFYCKRSIKFGVVKLNAKDLSDIIYYTSEELT
jgi:hypothetical protein